jgi:hypothetical protein
MSRDRQLLEKNMENDEPGVKKNPTIYFDEGKKALIRCYNPDDAMRKDRAGTVG